MNPQEPATGIDERRRSTRRDTDLRLAIDLATTRIEGRAENISSAGVFFFAHEPLRVTVHLEDGGRTVSYTGKLVRLERLSPETTGFAIEFDRP